MRLNDRGGGSNRVAGSGGLVITPSLTAVATATVAIESHTNTLDEIAGATRQVTAES
jgi:hypothetical protein